MKKPKSSTFESEYPAITRWIKQSGRIEIGGASFADPYVKAVNRDGLLWGGKREYATIDEALNARAAEIRSWWQRDRRGGPGTAVARGRAADASIAVGPSQYRRPAQ